jgi:Fe-S-cluster containining protein
VSERAAPESRPGFPFAFACKRSGNCCSIPGGRVRVDAEEAVDIAAFLGLDEAAFRTLFVQPDGVTLKAGLGNRCVFLHDGPQVACSIYPVRPHKCRTWPFWPEALADTELLAFMRRVCPGIVDRSGS